MFGPPTGRNSFRKEDILFIFLKEFLLPLDFHKARIPPTFS
jgi:hypothetical protein